MTTEEIRPIRRLGYDRYTAHGGDFGAAISRAVGVADPEHCAGLHLAMRC